MHVRTSYRRQIHTWLASSIAILVIASPVYAEGVLPDGSVQDVPLPTLSGTFEFPEGFGEDNGGGNDNGSGRQWIASDSGNDDGSNGGDMQNGTLDTDNVLLVLTPHCTNEDRFSCPLFESVDAEHTQTDLLTMGDILDVDIVLTAPDPYAIYTIRGWLQYDPTALEARSIELGDAMTQPIPGEQDIDASRGLIKIGGGTDGELTENAVTIARITFRVISVRKNSEITFLNYLEDGTGETTVLNENEESLLLTEPSTLNVYVISDDNGNTQTPPLSRDRSYTQPSVTTDTNPPTQPQGNGSFSILQVQNVRATSQGDSLFVGWSPLSSQEVTGYNVYYGTVSGRYIQRRSLSASSNSLSIRGLDTGLQYFIAIRAFNALQQETEFSQEVSVVIGRPETSTSPLLQRDIDSPTVPQNPIATRGGDQVVGETGVKETLMILLLIAAFIGTILAWRRQFSLTPVSRHG